MAPTECSAEARAHHSAANRPKPPADLGAFFFFLAACRRIMRFIGGRDAWAEARRRRVDRWEQEETGRARRVGCQG